LAQLERGRALGCNTLTHSSETKNLVSARYRQP
jgi:hypothetical protein